MNFVSLLSREQGKKGRKVHSSINAMLKPLPGNSAQTSTDTSRTNLSSWLKDRLALFFFLKKHVYRKRKSTTLLEI